MKKTLFILIISSLLYMPKQHVAFAQDATFYVFQGNRYEINPIDRYFSIVFSSSPDRLTGKYIEEVSERTGLKITRIFASENLWLLQVVEGSRDDILKFLENIRSHPSVEHVFNAVTANRDLLFLSGEIIVRYNSNVEMEQIRDITMNLDVGITAISETIPLYRLTISKKSYITNPVAFANFYAKEFRDKVAFASPNFFRVIRLLREPNDPDYAEEWWLKDLDASLGWDHTTGDEAIKIAVLDNGVDTRHPDLKFTEGYDAVKDRDDQTPNPWDGHGTAVAGLAAAVGNNGKGLSGVLWRSSIIPVRVFYSQKDNPSRTISSDEWLARGIRRAYLLGADVLLMAWGFTAPSDTVRDAIDEAYQKGRRGEGCVIVAAAGNNPDIGIHFPANLRNVMAVGAVDRHGMRWQYSSPGAELSVVAPSGTVPQGDIWTTDQIGSSGYSADDYYKRFGGTSAAASLAGGLAGLLLSADKKLKADKVRTIMEVTADDLGPPGRDQEYGHGRVNIGKAIKRAFTNP